MTQPATQPSATGHALGGCRPEPLGCYLKALGVLRLVGEQLDRDAAGWWRGNTFVLRTERTVDELVEFFLDAYSPAPLVAPWNHGSGFGEREQQAGIGSIEHSEHPRFAAYREAIAVGRRLKAEEGWEQLAKEAQVQRCRSELPDEAVAWVDTTVVLTTHWREFSPLLGTGGNIGRLEFSNTFMQRLVEAVGLPRGSSRPIARDLREQWLRAALLGEGNPALIAAPSGQFDPGAAGGVNSSPFGTAGGFVNPWDFVLLLEGALLFASGAARRLGFVEGPSRTSLPFMANSSPVGNSTTIESEKSRGELWTPLWPRPASAAEVTRLVNEGRSTWRGSQARSGLDFARAAALLGVDPGIDGFVRHAFVERLGQAMLAVPVDRVRVCDREHPAVKVTLQLDSWVNGLRRMPTAPRSLVEARLAIERWLYRIAVEDHDRIALQEVLAAVADAERIISYAPKLRDAVPSPIYQLRAADWLPLLDDGTAEFRIAAAIASQRDPRRLRGAGGFEERVERIDRTGRIMGALLRPIQFGLDGRRIEWSARPCRVDGLTRRSLVSVLADVFELRATDVAVAPRHVSPEAWRQRQGRFRSAGDRHDDHDHDGDDHDGDGDEHGHHGGRGHVGPLDPTGFQPAFGERLGTIVDDVTRFVMGELDLHRTGRLLAGMLLFDWRGISGYRLHTPRGEDGCRAVPPLLGLLLPFAHGRPITPAWPGVDRRETPAIFLQPSKAWPRQIRAGRFHDVCTDALRRLRKAGVTPTIRSVDHLAVGLDPDAIAAAFTIPLRPDSVGRALAQVVAGPAASLATMWPSDTADTHAHQSHQAQAEDAASETQSGAEWPGRPSRQKGDQLVSAAKPRSRKT